jgi:hypothetical protein
MRNVILAIVALTVTACGAWAESTAFPGGTLDVSWADDATLSVEIVLDAAPASVGNTAPMWVLTVNARRFADGIHSWQLHLGPTHQSIVVVPNDFLVTQRFTFAQLRVEVAAFEPGKTMSLRIPRSGAIPNLIVPGDPLEVHALWIQQAPLALARVPEPSVASPYVPSETVYEQGTPIRHAFYLTDPATGAPPELGAATIALMRRRENAADEIVRYIYRALDPSTGLISYEFDTTNLPAGIYALVVWVNPPNVTVRQELEIVSSAP